MSSMKCIGAVATLGALATGGTALYNGRKAKKMVVSQAQKIANNNGGKVPTGGMTKDGKMWDGFTTVDAIDKNFKKGVALSSAFSAVMGGISTAVIAGITLLAKAKLK